MRVDGKVNGMGRGRVRLGFRAIVGFRLTDPDIFGVLATSRYPT